jgi:hypothetical protein
MTVSIRSGVLLGLLALTVGCSSEAVPTMPHSASDVPAAVAAAVFVSPGSYQFSAPLSSNPVASYTATSKYVLSDDGAFFLELNGRGFAGTYQSESGPLAGYITLRFTGNQWEATARVNGNTLEVRYNLWAWGADLEDAVYKRTP